jgi:hypothetical protein
MQDINAIECDDNSGYQAEVLALQRAINGGLWGLQGSYGRAMMAAIEAGECMLGETEARDYWGSRIPSRTAVKAGTKGSREFVVDAHGEEWAAMLEAA